MVAYNQTSYLANGNGGSLSCPQEDHVTSDISKAQWLRKYSRCLLRSWLQWQTPLGIATAYTEQIKKDLAVFYDDPLKRMFIEMTYRRDSADL